MDNLHLARRNWRSHLRAALAIAKKDWLHFLRYPLNAVFRIVQPIMWLTPVYFLGKSFADKGSNVGFAAFAGTQDYMSFVLVGAILSNYVSAVFWGMGFSLKTEMDSGVLESNWMMPVPRPLFLAGQTIASLTIATVTGAGLLLLGALFFGFNATGNLLPAFFVLLPTLLALYGFGFAFAGIVLLLKDANTLVDVSDFLISMLSGSQFPVEVLPRYLLPVALLIPLTYGYDAVRAYLLGTRTLLPLRYEIAILAGFMVVMVALGYIVFNRVERHCRALGLIGTH